MKSKNLLVIFVILGIVALGGGFAYGLFTKEEPEKNDSTADSTVPADEEVLEKDTVPEPEIKEETTPETTLETETEIKENEENEENEKETALVTEEGLVAYYPFNEDIKDYSGEEIDATNHNAFFVEGKKGKALKFNGKNSYVHVPIDINPASMSQMTMAVWVKAEKGSIVVRQIIGNDNDEYDRSIDTDFRGGGKGWSCFAGDGKVLGYSPVVADKWTFVAAVYDQNAGTVKLFVDGSVYEKDGKMVDKGNDFILIGARGSIETQGHYFNGVIDEVRIYDYALSDKELNSLYETGIARPQTD